MLALTKFSQTLLCAGQGNQPFLKLQVVTLRLDTDPFALFVLLLTLTEGMMIEDLMKKGVTLLLSGPE